MLLYHYSPEVSNLETGSVQCYPYEATDSDETSETGRTAPKTLHPSSLI